MKRLSLWAWSDWRWATLSDWDFTLFRLHAYRRRGHWFSVDFMLMGFGVVLTVFKRARR